MTRFSRIFQAVGAAIVLMLMLSACGGGSGGGEDSDTVPKQASGPVVAWIGDDTIRESEFEHSLEVTEQTSAGVGGGVVPDPPTYTACVAGQRAAARVARTTPLPTEAESLRACKDIERQNREAALSRLIQGVWWENEARRRGVEVSDADVEATYQQLVRGSFPRPGAYERFLQRSGVTEDDLRADARRGQTATAVNEAVLQGVDPVDEDDLARYFDEHRAEFAIPERRDLELVIARTEVRADQAKEALADGADIATVTQQYSDSALTRALNGRLDGLAPGGMSRSFETLVFAAEPGVIVGPARGDNGWYVGRTTNVVPGEQLSLDAVRGQLTRTLTEQARTTAGGRFTTDFSTRWRAATRCAPDHLVQDCSNAPRPAPAPSGGAMRMRLPEETVRQLNEQRQRELAARRAQEQR